MLAIVTHLLTFAVVVIGWPLNFYVTARLWRLARANPTLQVIRDRAIVATGVLVLVVVFSFVFIDNDLNDPILSFMDTKIITRTATLAIELIPALYWLRLYRRH